MTFPAPQTRPVRRTFVSRRQSGFTLFEFGLVLLAVALAGYIVIGEVRKFQHRARRDQLIADLSSLAEVFEKYRAQRGEWPAATHPEVRIPRGMETVLAGTPWLAGPPVGGSYDWLPPAKPKTDEKEAAKNPAPTGMIALTAFSPGPALELTEEDLRIIDGKLDDGNLATGRFRVGFNRWPTYSVRPPRP